MDIDNVFGWISEFQGRVSFFIAPIDNSTTKIDWPDALITLTSTVVVALATLGAAYLAFVLTRRSEQRTLQKARNRQGAEDAIAGYLKLLQWLNLLANIENHIDGFFAEAHALGFNPDDPSLIVGPSTGVFQTPEKLSSPEYRFLLNPKDFRLVEEVLLLEQRGANAWYVLEEYSRLRLELDHWVTNLPGWESASDGPLATEGFPIEFRDAFERRVSQLNRVLCGLVEAIGADTGFGDEVLKKFLSAARRNFGDDFPNVSVRIGKSRSHIGPTSYRFTVQAYPRFKDWVRKPLPIGNFGVLRRGKAALIGSTALQPVFWVVLVLPPIASLPRL